MKFGNKTDDVRIQWVQGRLSELSDGQKLSDAGAGEQLFPRSCQHLDYTPQDFGQYDGVGNQEGLQIGTWDIGGLDIGSDITDIPVAPSSFDAILCTEVLEHIPMPEKAIEEFSRILRQDGQLILTAPFNSLTHFAPWHFCGFSRYWYEYYLPKYWFEILSMETNGSWFEFVAQELRRTRLTCKIYSSNILGLTTRILAIPMIHLLEMLDKQDRHSSELLCFGHMVVARKNQT